LVGSFATLEQQSVDEIQHLKKQNAILRADKAKLKTALQGEKEKKENLKLDLG